MASEVGTLLRQWRDRRGRSQLDLSVDIGVSQRHLSFIESGRSVPSRQMLLYVARQLDVPFRDQNALLLAAGYAPVYSDGELDAPEMRSVTKALERMLRQQEPFPALVMDRYWDVLMANASVTRFFSRFIDLDQRKTPRNLLHLMFDPDGMRPFLANWDDVARSLVERMFRESVGRAADDKTRRLLETVMAYPGVRPDWRAPVAASTPAVPLVFVRDETRLSLFSMVTTVGTPQTIVAQELRIECMFPADDATEAAFPAFVG